MSGAPGWFTAFHGMRVIESAMLEQDGEPYEARRSWRSRLFSRPWRPWKATFTVVPRIPYQGAMKIGPNTVVMHPATVRQMRSQFGSPTHD